MLFVVLGIILVCVVIIVGPTTWFLRELRPVSPAATEQLFTIEKGQGVKQIARNLHDAGLIRSPFAFQLYAWGEGVSGSMQAGTYKLTPAMDVPAIMRGIVRGDAVSNEAIITIREGWTNREIGDYLEGQGLFSRDAWLQAVAVTDSRTLLPDFTFSVLSNKPADASLEGYLFPDTYRVYKNATPADVVKKMLQNAEAKLTDDLRAKVQAQGRALFEVLTLASIIEREVQSERDKKLVADVFAKRLRDGIPLQADATLTYLLGKATAALTAEDLALDSPYNTYRYAGLPPGPIGNPGLDAILAVLEPEPNPYYYFLSAPSGETIYSVTLEEHNENKAKYLRSGQ